MADLICERASKANSVFWLAILDCKMGAALLARLVFPALIPQEKGPFWADVTKTGEKIIPFQKYSDTWGREDLLSLFYN